MFMFPPGGALLPEGSEPAGARRHRLVLLEGLRLLLSEGDLHDDTTTQLQTPPVALVGAGHDGAHYNSLRPYKQLLMAEMVVTSHNIS